MGPRLNRISWSDHHMLLALVTSLRSPDPNTQVGACIVDKDNKVLSTGYNGPPKGFPVKKMPWAREGKPEETKYAYVMHAEANAILNATTSIIGSSLFITLFPCNDCAKLIISSGIRSITYLNNLYPDAWQTKVAKNMFDIMDIPITKHAWSKNPKEILTGVLL